MRNPTYAADFQDIPRPERLEAVCSFGQVDQDRPEMRGPILSMGIKTITHNRDGLKLHPHKVIAVEMSEGDELASFDLAPPMARRYGDLLKTFADAIETEKAS